MIRVIRITEYSKGKPGGRQRRIAALPSGAFGGLA